MTATKKKAKTATKNNILHKCLKCKKPRGDHSANHLYCPVGRKDRTFGYTNFSKTEDTVFTPDPNWVNPNKLVI